MSGALSLLRSPAEMAQGNPIQQMQSPVNLMNVQGPPPTPRGIPSASGGPGPGWRMSGVNPRGLNRSGRVNTTIPNKKNTSIESNLLNQAANTQR
jgi:hypothetical protein